MCDEQQLEMILGKVSRCSKTEFGNRLVDVILYGSYARGEQESDSDIDVMVLVDERAESLAESRRAFSKLNSDIDLEYGITVSPILEDYQVFEYWKDALPFYRNVDVEGIRLDA
jgi:predicted nucleotidyltransferase